MVLISWPKKQKEAKKNRPLQPKIFLLSLFIIKEAIAVTAVEEKHPVNRCSLAQVEGMMRFSQVSGTQEQINLYIALRESKGTLNDQRLLAEVFLLTGDKTSYDSFIQSYPNIFADLLPSL